MILFVEGPRACGKTYLIDNFIMRNRTNPPKVIEPPVIEYYKFYFADHIKTLGLVERESDPILHYFSLGNIMTIMEMNLRPEYKNKVWVFDRAIISAYAWAVLRNRLTIDQAKAEYLALLRSDLFHNCSTIMVTVDHQTSDSNRKKDTFDGAHSTFEELEKLSYFISIGVKELSSIESNNRLDFVPNYFDQESSDHFTNTCFRLLNLPA